MVTTIVNEQTFTGIRQKVGTVRLGRRGTAFDGLMLMI